MKIFLFPHLWLKAGDNGTLMLTGGLIKVNSDSMGALVCSVSL